MVTFIEVLQWIWAHALHLIGLFILIRYWKPIYTDLVFSPLAGGNGKVQMDEAAKGVILMVFVGSATADALRTTEYRVFSDGYYLSLLGVVALIAGIKHGVQLMRRDDPKKKSTSDSNSEHTGQ